MMGRGTARLNVMLLTLETFCPEMSTSWEAPYEAQRETMSEPFTIHAFPEADITAPPPLGKVMPLDTRMPETLEILKLDIFTFCEAGKVAQRDRFPADVVIVASAEPFK